MALSTWLHYLYQLLVLWAQSDFFKFFFPLLIAFFLVSAVPCIVRRLFSWR